MNIPIYCQNIFNEWMQFLVFVDEQNEEEAVSAIGLALEEFENSSTPYGELVEFYLKEAGIEYEIKFCEYDSDNDCTTPAWDAYVDAILSSADIVTI